MPGVDTPRASIFVSVDITRFCECVRILRDVAKAPDLVEVTLARSLNQEPGYAWLGFMTFHSAGWWERNGMAVPYTSQVIARRAVVDLAALTEHMESIRAAESAGTTGVEWSAGSLVVGGFVVRSRPGTVPNIPVVGPVRDSVYMASGANAWRGAIVETEQGRVAVPPPLVAHLQYRKAAVVEFGAVDGEVVLVAQSDQHGHPSKVAPTIVAPVELLTWTEDAEPAQVEERRRGGREVEQLLAALDPGTPVHTLLELLDTSIGYIRRRVAANPGLPESVIDEIAEHGTVAMRIGVAGNAVLPERSVRRLVSDPESMVRAALAANEHVVPELLGALAWDLHPEVRAAVATHVPISAEARAHLASDPAATVRGIVAAHPATDAALLAVLARDPEPAVCAAVASNPSCPAAILDDLVAVAPLMALINPNVSPRLLVAGAQASDPTLRARVAANPATPVRVFSSLARDGDEEVLRAVVANPRAPKSARDRAEKRLGTADA